MNTIVAIILAASIGHPVIGPKFENKAACVKEAQENGYQAVKSQVEGDVKIYCVNPKDYPDETEVTVENLKETDLVPEK